LVKAIFFFTWNLQVADAYIVKKAKNELLAL